MRAFQSVGAAGLLGGWICWFFKVRGLLRSGRVLSHRTDVMKDVVVKRVGIKNER